MSGRSPAPEPRGRSAAPATWRNRPDESTELHVAALSVDLHFSQVHSLKEKRAVIRPILDGCRQRFAVAAAETDHHDRWQRAALGFATVAGSPGHAGAVLDAVERFVWSFPEVEVLAMSRHWLDAEDS